MTSVCDFASPFVSWLDLSPHILFKPYTLERLRMSFIIVAKQEGYAIVQFNRPDVLNAINMKLMEELVDALESLDNDNDIRCIILTGNEKAFAAGADIKEMADASAME